MDFLNYWDTRIDANERFFNDYPHIANFAFSECQELWDHMSADYAALLARHNALEKDHNVSLMLLARERAQRDALLTLRDTDEWRSGAVIGGHIVSKFVAERELKTLKNSHNALVEAVAWEKELDAVLVWLVQAGLYPRDMAGKYDLANERECARAEVDRLIANESAANCKGEG